MSEVTAFIVCEIDVKQGDYTVTFHGVFTSRDEAEKRVLLLKKDYPEMDPEIEETPFNLPLPTVTVGEMWSAEIKIGDFKNFRVKRIRSLIGEKACNIDMSDLEDIKVWTFSGAAHLADLLIQTEHDYRKRKAELAKK